jgi:hypothetical protein
MVTWGQGEEALLKGGSLGEPDSWQGRDGVATVGLGRTRRRRAPTQDPSKPSDLRSQLIGYLVQVFWFGYGYGCGS